MVMGCIVFLEITKAYPVQELVKFFTFVMGIMTASYNISSQARRIYTSSSSVSTHYDYLSTCLYSFLPGWCLLP